jgi:hypothetical protein
MTTMFGVLGDAAVEERGAISATKAGARQRGKEMKSGFIDE